MSQTYAGISGALTDQSTLAITSVVDATPLKVNTSVAHNLTTGDVVQVHDHNGTSATRKANVIASITVTSATSFTLDGTTGTGGGDDGAGSGSVYPMTFHAGSAGTPGDAPFPIPSDGDPRSASSVNSAFEPLADRAAKLLLLQGGLRRLSPQGSSSTSGAWAVRDYQEIFSDDSPTYNTNIALLDTAATDTWEAVPVPAGSPLFKWGTIFRLSTTDVVLVRLYANLNADSGAVTAVDLGFDPYAPGESPSGAPKVLSACTPGTPLRGTPIRVPADTTSLVISSLVPWTSIANGRPGGNFDIYLMARHHTAGTKAVGAYGNYRIEAMVLR